MIAKGSTVQGTLEFLRVSAEPHTVGIILDALPEACRNRLVSSSAVAEVPYEDLVALWEAADAMLAPEDPAWVERQGAFAIEQLGPRLYSGLLRKRSPEEFLSQGVSLFQLYYHPGNVEVVDRSPGHAVVRLVGFHVVDRFFCRRFTGAWPALLRVAGGVDTQAHHVRCAREGDAFCEWELGWRVLNRRPARTRTPKRAAGHTAD
jgi:hypothetical protein